MSKYEYIDDFDQPLTIKAYEWADNSKTVMITVPSGQSNITPEDAPAVALAILESAGFEPSDVPAWKTGSPTGVRVVVNILREHVETRAKRAEREAEDAKVVEFHTAIGANLNRIERHHLDLYRAARKFFEGS